MYVCGWNENKGFKYYTLRLPVVSVQKRKQLRAHVGVLDHRQRLWVCNRGYDVDCVGGVDILGVWPEVDLRRVSCDLNAKLLFMPLSVSCDLRRCYDVDRCFIIFVMVR